MNYRQTIDYLYNSAPLFQNIGAKAYKPGLGNTVALDEFFEHPHTRYTTIHIAGTNGKGSCAHTLAAVLQAHGYRTGLYTSPHLVDFRERMRIDGQPIPESYVVDFVEKYRSFFEPLHPSFFELTTALAFQWFAESAIDIAVIETGLGGRLDCTNIINPALSVITNISYDHTQFLGSTLSQIAGEKAGIIKHDTPVVIGEYTPETRKVFEDAAKAMHSPIVFAQDEPEVTRTVETPGALEIESTLLPQTISYCLTGEYQKRNANTILCAIKQMRKVGIGISDDSILQGFADVNKTTGLRGRWEILSQHPTVIADTAHNSAGLKYTMQQLEHSPARELRIVIGMVSDKDIDASLALMPRRATFYFTQASVKRALDARELQMRGEALGLHGRAFPNVKDAYVQAMRDADADDVIYVGGSNFVVGDLLQWLEAKVNADGKD